MIQLVALLLATNGASWLGPKPPSHPARIATLGPSLTELVQALGAGDRLVAVSRYDDDPSVSKLPRIGGLMDPSAEAILAARPDLLVVQPSPTIVPILERVAELGVPVLELSLSDVAEVEQAERALGQALGAKGAGEKLAAQLEARLAHARARAKAATHPRVLMVYGWTPLVVAGPGSFADELLAAVGGLNAATAAKTPYATYSAEEAAAARPDVLLDLTFDEPMPAAFAKLPGLATARRARPRTLALLHPGPKLVQGLDELEAALRPAAAVPVEVRDGG